MNRSICLASHESELLVQYWLGELDASRETIFEEHLFGCASCTTRLQELVGIADGIRALIRNGAVRGVVSHDFLERLATQGLRLREYQVDPNGSVNCTVAPDDDLIVSRLRAPLADVTCLDLVVSDREGVELERLQDIQFNPAAGEVVYIPSIAFIRTLPATTICMHLLARDNERAIQIGEYPFLHTPHQ
jgi:hypothetical protein